MQLRIIFPPLLILILQALTYDNCHRPCKNLISIEIYSGESEETPLFWLNSHLIYTGLTLLLHSEHKFCLCKVDTDCIWLPLSLILGVIECFSFDFCLKIWQLILLCYSLDIDFGGRLNWLLFSICYFMAKEFLTDIILISNKYL